METVSSWIRIIIMSSGIIPVTAFNLPDIGGLCSEKRIMGRISVQILADKKT